MQKEGTVIKSTGSWYNILLKDGRIIKSRIRGRFKLKGKVLTNPVAVGDNVKINIENYEDTGIIEKILPRFNYVVRQSPRKKHQLHFLASNIDLAVLVVTIIEPNLKQGFIDRFLLMTEPFNIPTIIVFNKKDLLNEDGITKFEYLKMLYENIGYKVILVSALDGDLAELKGLLKNKISLFSGHSGVGKSTLLNNLEPKIMQKTKEISDNTGKGQHTTTFAEMFELEDNTFIIDTPGIKTLSFLTLEVMDVAHNFREFFILSKNCKYNNCTHRNEPDCAVKQAAKDGIISQTRYQNYLSILEDIDKQNYWERKNDY